MPPSTFVGTEYSSLSPSHANDDLRPKVEPLILAANKPPQKLSLISRYSFILRIVVFILIELGFIILASLTKSNPIPIHLSSNISLTEAKGALTIISVIWHSLAILIVKDILLHMFSAEWIEQYRRTGSIVLGETDNVSRLTAGFFDKINHFASRKATIPFCLAFISTLLLIALNGLGSSALTVDSIATQIPLKTKIANLTLKTNLLHGGNDLSILDLVNLITRLEQVEGRAYGFGTNQTNMLIPWPSSDLMSSNGTIRYHSDIVTCNFSCSWEPPGINGSQIDPGLEVDYREWFPYYPMVTWVGVGWEDATILPMAVSGKIGGLVNSSVSAFVFIGSNTTLSKRLALNLEGVPTLFLPENVIRTNRRGTNTSPMLISVLLCNPQLRISPATVSLTGLTLQATTFPGPPVVKNFPVGVAHTIFSQTLLSATSIRASYHDGWSLVNDISTILFFPNRSFVYDDKPEGVKPFLLDQINQQMNTVLLSSAKALLRGYKPRDNHLIIPSFEMIDTDASVEVQQLGLVGSKPFLIVLIVVVGVLVVFLVTLMAVVKGDQLHTFDLKNIIKTLQLQ